MVRVSTLLILLYISINSNNVYADERSGESHQETKVKADTQHDSLQTIKPLNLTIDPDIIKEPKKQQNAVIKKSDQLLPDIFKDEQEHKISIEGGVLVNDKSTKSEVIDGAEMSIKIKTGQ